MLANVKLILLIAAFLCFVFSATSYASDRTRVIGLGLACWVGSLLF